MGLASLLSLASSSHPCCRPPTPSIVLQPLLSAVCGRRYDLHHGDGTHGVVSTQGGVVLLELTPPLSPTGAMPPWRREHRVIFVIALDDVLFTFTLCPLQGSLLSKLVTTVNADSAAKGQCSMSTNDAISSP
jgi:hypothetical protein